MDGAAITITIMTLAAANTLGIQVSLPAAIVLSAMSALGACGASGVAGGSLLLIPMACSLFGISNDVAMQMVGKVRARGTQILLFLPRHQIPAEFQCIDPVFLEFPFLVHCGLYEEAVVKNDLVAEKREVFGEGLRLTMC